MKNLSLLLSLLLLYSLPGLALRPMMRAGSFTPLHAAGPAHPFEKGGQQRVRANVPEGQLVLSQSFDGCTAGTEASPDSEEIVGEIPQEWTGQTGWLGATAHQAGGCLYLAPWETTMNGQPFTVHLLDTPQIPVPADAASVTVTFRARSTAAIPLYIINAVKSNGSSISSRQVELSPSWQDFEISFTDLTSACFLEFQTDEAPFFIDDIRIYAASGLSKPKVLPATDITSDSYTANWKADPRADGYMVYPRIIRVSDGMEPVWLINTDFSTLREGTIDNPIEPTVIIESLDAVIDQAGWLVRLPLKAEGALGLTNKYLTSYGNSLLQSPTLNLQAGGGTVDVDMRWLAQDVDMFQVCIYDAKADGSVSLRSTKMVYTGGVENKWTESKFTLGGGTSSSLIVILLPETTKGTIFLDRLGISQTLPEGERFTIPMSTLGSDTNSVKVLTPGLRADDSRAYSVKAYKLVGTSSIVSEESNIIIVGADSDEQPTSLATPTGVQATVQGGQFSASWEPVSGANAYEVQLFRRHTSDGNESVAIVDENFDAIRVGTTDLDHPRLMHEDGYDRLDDFTKVPGWEVFQGFYVDGAVGILGYWNMLGVGCYMKSPIFDLSADGGNMTLSLRVGTDYYQQGATVFLAHNDPETGATVYDDMFPLDEMAKGFHPFTTTLKGGREDSYLVFFPYGYGMSYFDDILVTQMIPAGTSDTRISSRKVYAPQALLTVPDVKETDEYFFTVRALWLDPNDIERVSSPASQPTFLQGVKPSTYHSGTVLDTDGNPVAGATLTLIPASPEAPRLTAVSNRWGLFRINNVTEADLSHHLTVSAPGYRSAFADGLTFSSLQPLTEATYTLRPAYDESIEIGTPDSFSETGALHLGYNNSESETIYPASLLPLPKDALIKEITFEGYGLQTKEIKPTVNLWLENVEADSHPAAEPLTDASLAPFCKQTFTLDAIGMREAPDSLLRFVAPQGFKYTGQGLAVRLLSKATKNSSFQFIMDSSGTGSSLLRTWSKGDAPQEWERNEAGIPVMRVLYTDPVNSLDQVAAIAPGQPFSVISRQGGIAITATADCTLPLFTAQGILMQTLTLKAGETIEVTLPAGLYLISSTKVLIK